MLTARFLRLEVTHLQTARPLLAEALEAALVILRLLPFARVAHEPERAGGVDLHAELNAAEEALPSTGMRFAGVQREGAH